MDREGGEMKEDEKKELLGQLEKERLLKDLKDLSRQLTRYKSRQDNYRKTKFSDEQKKNLDTFRLRLKDKYGLLKKIISEYGGDTNVKIVGIDWNVFVYSLRSLNMSSDQFSALDKAIKAVNIAVEKVEAIPVASIDWRDIGVKRRITDTIELSVYLFDNIHLHDKITEASEALFKDGHYAQAIFEAFKAVENVVREKAGLSSYGKNLMAQAFNEENPPIMVTEAGMPDKEVQEGFKFLFMGAMLGIRNPKAHYIISQNDPFLTLEYLGFASFLLKRIEGWQLNPSEA